MADDTTQTPPTEKQQPFVHLHVHTDYSLLDGACAIERLMKHAAKLGQPAVAITDHGNLFGLADFYGTSKKLKDKGCNIKPLLGCEIYLSAGPREDKTIKPNHMGLLARNFKGYQNLVRLVTDAHIVGMYRKPRADMDTLAAMADGLIGFTGCLQGVIPQALLRGDMASARAWAGRFVEIFGRENYFVEIQDHGLPEQLQIIPGLLRIAEEFKLKVVCTNDVHYVECSDAPTHDVLLCIQTGARVSDEKRMRYANDQFYLKSHDEMFRLFGAERPDALTNTLAVAEMCDVKLPFGENHYPVFTMPKDRVVKVDAPALDDIARRYEELKTRLSGKEFRLSETVLANLRTNGAYLLEICKRGLMERYGVDFDNPADYVPIAGKPADFAHMLVERIRYELSVIAGTGFTDYFLIINDYIRWAGEQGIPVGPGRGSGAGCLVAYLVHITDIDPIRFNLLFERFLNPERVSPPDFDIDFCMRRRDRVVDYVREKYGHDAVANIITFGTFGAKMVVRDVCRVLDIPFSEADRIAKLIPESPDMTLEKALELSAELRHEVETNPIAKAIIQHGNIIEGMVRNTGKHACGVIIGDRPLVEFVPLTLQEGALTTQYPKEPVENLGLLKMDFLGLKTLTVIDDAVVNIRHTADPKFDIRTVPLEDQPTFDLLASGKTVAVFQLESGGMQKLCRDLRASNVDEIIALIALYRPGPMQFIQDFIAGKLNPSGIKYAHPLLEPITKETYGILVYQEQVMEAAKVLAGYSLGGADMLRRAMGKKKPEEMAKQRDSFCAGALRVNNIPKDKADELFDVLEKFAAYGFNKSHSAAYGILSYQTAYLKANYPVQFMAAVLTGDLGNAEKLIVFLAECENMGIQVRAPDINRSRETFTPVVPADGKDAHILFGFSGVKGVGDSAAQVIIAEREKNGPYKDFRDFVQRVDGKAVNRRVAENLIKVGAFDAFGQDRGILLENYEALAGEAAASARDRERGQASFFDDLMGGGDMGGKPEKLAGKPMTIPDKLLAEKELLGFYVSGHPLDEYGGLAEALNSFRGDAWRNLPDKTPFRICGVLSGLEKRISKKDNRPWAIVHLGTKEATYEFAVFSGREKNGRYSPGPYDQFEGVLRDTKVRDIERLIARQFGAKGISAQLTADASHEDKDVVYSTDILFAGDGASGGGSSKGSKGKGKVVEKTPAQLLQEQLEFAKTKDNLSTLAKPGMCFVIHGVVSKRDGADPRLQVNEILPLGPEIPRLFKGVTWVIRPDGESVDFIAKLRESLDNHIGDVPVRLAVRDPGSDWCAVNEIAGSLKWRLTPREFRALRRHPAVIGASLEVCAIPVPANEWEKFKKRSGN